MLQHSEEKRDRRQLLCSGHSWLSRSAVLILTHILTPSQHSQEIAASTVVATRIAETEKLDSKLDLCFDWPLKKFIVFKGFIHLQIQFEYKYVQFMVQRYSQFCFQERSFSKISSCADDFCHQGFHLVRHRHCHTISYQVNLNNCGGCKNSYAIMIFLKPLPKSSHVYSL